ncbi:hypothetical protein TNCV_4290651 [Trichonephila clavipes]|nr:hypothetical protein TNCV_4290651 [Trichonephila clavipes]
MNDFSSSLFLATDTGRVDSVKRLSPSVGTPQEDRVNVTASEPSKQTPGSCTYGDCGLSVAKAGICTPVLQLDVH